MEFRAETVALYVAGAVAFGLGIWGTLGPVKAQEYFAGYLLEQSLSIDNLFVFILVFNYFQTPLAEQGKVRNLQTRLLLCTAIFFPSGLMLLHDSNWALSTKQRKKERVKQHREPRVHIVELMGRF